MKAFNPLLLIAISIGFFFLYINPTYTNIGVLQDNASQYQSAIVRAQEVGVKRDELVNKYNTVNSEDLTRLQKILPDKVDTVRLAVDINSLASKYGATISDIKVDNIVPDPSAVARENAIGQAYSTTAVSFVTKMTYENFVKFLADIEKSLRVGDISAATFTSADNGTNTYQVTLKTYWLK